MAIGEIAEVTEKQKRDWKTC